MVAQVATNTPKNPEKILEQKNLSDIGIWQKAFFIKPENYIAKQISYLT